MGWPSLDQKRSNRIVQPVSVNYAALSTSRGFEGVVALRLALITLLVSVLVTAGAAVASTGFLDVPEDHVFADEIVWLADEGITRGCNPPANDRFCPTDVVTRGQMAAFLSRGFELPDGGDVDFVDDDGLVFETDIERLAAAGITLGCNPPTNDRFCPSDVVTRGQMAAFLERALGLTEIDEGVSFVDTAGSMFEGSINRLATAGITRGCNPPANDRFCPDDVVTREQMAAFLHRAFTRTPQITTPTLPGGTVGTPYSATLEAKWGRAPYTWTATGVPDGLTLAPDGSLTGVPATAEEATVSVEVTDGRDRSDAATLVLDIDAPLEILTDELPKWVVDEYQHFALRSVGGELRHYWSSTELPDGIVMNTFGAITGRPTQVGLFPVTWTVADGDGRVASVDLVLEVVDTFHVIGGDLVDGTVGEAYSDGTTAVGGFPPYTWDARGLPDGLHVDGQGTVTGIPTVSGTFSGAVIATDSEANTASARVTIFVYQPVVVVTTELPVATIGEWWSTALDADGGKGQHHWTGEVPAGLTLADHGFLSGYPEDAGDLYFTVEVSDDAGRTAQQSLMIESRDPVEITTTSLPGGTVWESYSAHVAGTGGEPPYTWRMGSDPVGLDVDDNGHITGTPGAPGEFSASLLLTDASGRTAGARMPIDIDLPLQITTTELVDAAAYDGHTQFLSAYGGEPPYEWSASSLPPGLSVSNAGLLSGTPTVPGVHEVTVSVADADGRVTTAYTDMFVSGMVLVSRAPDGEPGNAECSGAAISGDGRYVIVECAADNFVTGDSNGLVDAYRHDRETGDMVWVSRGTTAARTEGVFDSVIDYDGDIVAFSNWGDFVIPGDDNGWGDVFLYDDADGSLVRMSEAPDATGGDHNSRVWGISDDGRWVSFSGGASNLVVPDTNNAGDAFFYDVWTGDLTIEGVTEGGAQPSNGAQPWDVSGDGRYLVFGARGPEFDPRQTLSTSTSIFMRDRVTGDVTLISDTYNGNLMTSAAFWAVVDYDGSYVAYMSYSDDILPESVDGRGMIYQYETATGITRLVSKATTGAILNSSSSDPFMSGDGRFVAYYTVASNGSPEGNNLYEAYVWDLETESTVRLSLTPGGAKPDGWTKPYGISSDGAWVVVVSEASNLVPGDTNGVADVFVAAVDNR